MHQSRIVLKVAIVLALLVAGLYAWRLLANGQRSPAPAVLAERAMQAATDEERQRAAVELASSGEAGQEHLRRLLRAGPDPAVRAICAQGLADGADYDGVDVLIAALDDESSLVRAHAAAALSRLLRRKVCFPADAAAAERSQAKARIQKTWEDLCRWSAVAHLQRNVPLEYYYDRNTGELFEGPAAAAGLAPAASGPYQGMPAGVRAHVFTQANDAAGGERYIGFLSVSASALGQAHAEKTGDGSGGAAVLVCRPGTTDWVDANSPAGAKIIGAAIRGRAGKGPLRQCLPGQ